MNIRTAGRGAGNVITAFENWPSNMLKKKAKNLPLRLLSALKPFLSRIGTPDESLMDLLLHHEDAKKIKLTLLDKAAVESFKTLPKDTLETLNYVFTAMKEIDKAVTFLIADFEKEFATDMAEVRLRMDEFLNSRHHEPISKCRTAPYFPDAHRKELLLHWEVLNDRMDIIAGQSENIHIWTRQLLEDVENIRVLKAHPNNKAVVSAGRAALAEQIKFKLYRNVPSSFLIHFDDVLTLTNAFVASISDYEHEAMEEHRMLLRSNLVYLKNVSEQLKSYIFKLVFHDAKNPDRFTKSDLINAVVRLEQL